MTEISPFHTLQRSWRYLTLGVRGFVVIILSLILFSLFVLFAAFVLLFTWFPAWIGSLIPAEKWLRMMLKQILDFERMKSFRDEMLEMTRRHIEFSTEWDRHWMLQEMDAAANRIDRKLRSGKYVLAIVGGFSSILLAEFVSVQYASVVLVLFIISLSTAILFRIVITDTLVYDAELYQSASYDEIMVKLGWNRGPINGKGAVLTALGTTIAGLNDWGYDIGLSFVDWYVSFRYGDYDVDKWRDERA